MFKKLFLGLSLFLASCDYIASTSNNSTQKVVTCKLNKFKGFPKTVRGPVTFELKNTISIAIFNKNKTQRVDLTFLKRNCR